LLGRGVEPVEFVDAHGAEGEAELGEVAAEDFGLVVVGAGFVVLRRVEAEDAAGAGAGGAAGALADGALLMRPMRRVGRPVQGEKAAWRARPLSMTVVTPSMVMELSATLVERMILGWLEGATARSCSAGGRSP